MSNIDQVKSYLVALQNRICVELELLDGKAEFLRDAGAAIVTFSPLANESPAADADAVFLPGGYPELHGPQLST